VFRYTFDEIASIVGRTPGACRQLAVSARRRVTRGDRRVSDASLGHDLVMSLMEAWRAGDVDGLIRLFDGSVRMTTDGGGAVGAPRRPIVGARRVARALTAVLRRDPDLVLELADINGEPGLVVREGRRTVTSVVSVSGRSERVTDIWVIRNPDKMSPWTSTAPPPPPTLLHADGRGRRRSDLEHDRGTSAS
jgi:RNA polymerase sigma-70 factor (ECF subfamily)